MNRALKPLGCFLILLGCFAAAQAQQTGLMPVPVFQNVQLQAQTAFDVGTQFYTYNYTVTNPASNTGQLRSIRIDITRPGGSLQFPSFGLSLPIGGQNLSFDDFVSV